MLTGSGISAESGIPTFRGPDGIWKKYRSEEIASPEMWRRNPRLVWEFYSMRRKAAADKVPNAAHFALANLEKALGDRLLICTQNVDDLHEKAGSQRVLHMHGNLYQTRCEKCGIPPFEDYHLYDEVLPNCRCGAHLRPHICWFGEIPYHLERIYHELEICTVFVAIGTSGLVHPAAAFVAHARLKGQASTCCYVGPEKPANHRVFDQLVLESAVEALPRLFDLSRAKAQ